jgi:hypothetical protein
MLCCLDVEESRRILLGSEDEDDDRPVSDIQIKKVILGI